MASFNQVTLLGNVGKDPEVRSFEKEGKTTKVAQFTLATSNGRKDNEETQWHNIVLWSPLAEIAESYVRKGSSVLIAGELRYRSYTGSDGQKRQITEIVGRTLQLVGKKEESKTYNTQNEAPRASRPADDLPDFLR